VVCRVTVQDEGGNAGNGGGYGYTDILGRGVKYYGRGFRPGHVYLVHIDEVFKGNVTLVHITTGLTQEIVSFLVQHYSSWVRWTL